MAKIRVFDVDAALETQRPHVRFRGKLYPIRDLVLSDRLAKMQEFQDAQMELEKDEERTPDERLARLRQLLAQAVQESLEGVPDDVAAKVTEWEFKLLTSAVAKARNVEFGIEGKDEEAPAVPEPEASGETAN